ncbi:MAG: endonuclease NucS [Chloroflexota bacterium]|nr:endonuclease NucS [Chloroflexota bacterium]
MAIYKMVGDKERLDRIAPTSFGQEGVLERSDLQRILRDQPEVLEDGLFIITEEFSNWEGSGRSIDLLGLDATGRLVVIELKRGDTGSHMELQAIRYAAMVSAMTLQQAIETHRAYLARIGSEEDAEERIRDHLENSDGARFASERPRIILASEGFSSELTTCALWLNESGLDVTCIRMQPHRSGPELLIETSQTIPLPEAQSYLVRIREREEELSKRRSEQEGLVSFAESIETVPVEFQTDMKRILAWVESLEVEKLAVVADNGRRYGNLLIRSYRTKRPLAKVNSGEGRNKPPWFYLNAPNLRKFAPGTIPALSKCAKRDLSNIDRLPTMVLKDVSNELLCALTQAYREANGRLSSEEQASEELQTQAE